MQSGPPPAFVNKALLQINKFFFLCVLSLAAFALWGQNRVVAMESLWFAKLRIFTLRSFTESFLVLAFTLGKPFPILRVYVKSQIYYEEIIILGSFPGGLVVRIQHFHYCGPGFNPWPGNWDPTSNCHMLWPILLLLLLLLLIITIKFKNKKTKIIILNCENNAHVSNSPPQPMAELFEESVFSPLNTFCLFVF